jgi:ribosome-binding factor A
MAAGPRPSRVGDQLRAELSELLAREVHDPGIGFLTITHVKVTPDLQIARVYYTTLGDDRARRESDRALHRAAPFLRRQVGSRLRLKRVPQLEFFFDESVERGDRIEQILHDLNAERAAGPGDDAGGPTAGGAPDAPLQQTERDERDTDE